jgi:hypothetical protein
VVVTAWTSVVGGAVMVVTAWTSVVGGTVVAGGPVVVASICSR